MNKSTRKIIGCAAVIEEMLPVLPPDISYEILDFGLHFRPKNLKDVLQKAIDKSAKNADTILLGYGLCSNGAVGLKAPKTATLVIPKVHDCIAIFLGSHESYKQQLKTETGTFFLAKGFIEVGDTPLDEYHRTIEQYGREKADMVMKIMFGHYTRLLFINTGHNELGKYRVHAQQTARQFGLRYEETKGSRVLIEKMIHGPWDEEFIIVQPGDTVTLGHFLQETSKEKIIDE
jgi:hypothetical protein